MKYICVIIVLQGGEHMKILICDDTQTELDVTYKYVTEYFKKKNLSVKIDTFTDCNIVLNLLTF